MPEVEVLPAHPVHHSLAENEAIIARGLSSFVEVGQALAEIRDAGQYRQAGYDDFDSYVKARWAMGRDNADRTIAAAEVTTAVVTSGLPAPVSEYSVRPLVVYLNDKGAYSRHEHRLLHPERGYEAVVEAWREIVEAHEDPDEPITRTEVMGRLYPPANMGTSKSWLVALGTVGDKIKAADKAMDRAERMIGTRQSKRVAEKAEEYATWADQLARRLRELASD